MFVAWFVADMLHGMLPSVLQSVAARRFDEDFTAGSPCGSAHTTSTFGCSAPAPVHVRVGIHPTGCGAPCTNPAPPAPVQSPKVHVHVTTSQGHSHSTSVRHRPGCPCAACASSCGGSAPRRRADSSPGSWSHGSRTDGGAHGSWSHGGGNHGSWSHGGGNHGNGAHSSWTGAGTSAIKFTRCVSEGGGVINCLRHRF